MVLRRICIPAHHGLRRAVPPMVGLALLLLALSVRAAPPNTANSAMLARGAAVAENQCSACHVVAQNQENPPLLRNPAPSFEEIANRSGSSEKQLRHFVSGTHWDLKTLPMTMPNPELSPKDTTAVVRYIMSLRKP